MTPRGGSRKGAGRPKLPDARETLAVRILPINKLRLERAAEKYEISMGELLDQIAENFFS